MFVILCGRRLIRKTQLQRRMAQRSPPPAATDPAPGVAVSPDVFEATGWWQEVRHAFIVMIYVALQSACIPMIQIGSACSVHVYATGSILGFHQAMGLVAIGCLCTLFVYIIICLSCVWFHCKIPCVPA